MQKSRYALLGFAAVIIAGGLAYYLGYFPNKTPDVVAVDKPMASAPAVTAQSEPTPEPAKAPAVPEPATATVAPAPVSADNTAAQPAPQPAQQVAVPAPMDTQATAQPAQQPAETTPDAAAKPNGPSFDVLRVEPDGSVVIAGKASQSADVDVISGARVLGSAKANAGGDFVIALDQALQAGDHQLVLRATGPDNKVATSAQTAIVSIPDDKKGQVLALVEEPGQASRMISTPSHVETPVVVQSDQPAPATKPATTPTADKPAKKVEAPIAVEAVEIEGGTIFVAGSAARGNRVSVYANDILLGGSAVSSEGRFLVQSKQPLAVGDYIIRADLIDKSNTVIASARVPFHREAGENVTAVARDTSTQTEAAPVAGATDNAATEANAANGAQAMEKVDGSVIIRKGDNLWTISKRTYGRGTRYTTIYLANQDQIRDPNLILPGQVFVMPTEPLSDEEAAKRLLERSN